MLQKMYGIIYTEELRFLILQELSLAKCLRGLGYAEKQTCLCQSLTFSDVPYAFLKQLILACK